MAGRAFLFLVVPANLVASAKQKSSAPLPTQDESIPAKLASRFDLADEPAVHHAARNWQMCPLALTRVGRYSWGQQAVFGPYHDAAFAALTYA